LKAIKKGEEGKKEKKKKKKKKKDEWPGTTCPLIYQLPIN